MGTETRETPKKGRARTGWQEPFLEALARSGNVRASCETAGVGRATVYRERDRDEAFRDRWTEAEEQAAETLEQEAFRRAVDGVARPVYQGGKLVGAIREYSDTLLIFLLKARRPDRYREHHRERPAGITLTELARLAQKETR